MIILWYADFNGTDEDLIKVNRIFDEITKNIGGTVEGPYYPETEAYHELKFCSCFEIYYISSQ